MSKHTAHLVISINGRLDEQVRNCILLSKVIVAIINSTNVLGVYWYNIQTIRSPEEFENKIVSLDEESLPIELWVDIRMRMNGNFKQDIYTVGMDKLGLKNIEILCPSFLYGIFEPYHNQKVLKFEVMLQLM